MRLLPKMLIGIAFWFLNASLASATSDRFALVIGNSDYDHVVRLDNPENDSRDIAAELKNLGFEVTLANDLNRDEFVSKLRKFRSESANSKQTLVYFAGHGIEIDKTNFLIPTDAKLISDFDVEFEAVPLDLVVRAASGGSELQLVVLDACRDNPFAKKMTRSTKTRSIGRGLAPVEPRGITIVAYAAREGTYAYDGEGQRNSPYAAAFLNAIRTPGLEVGKMLRHIRDDVLNSTGMEQEPFYYGSLSAKDFYINPPKSEAQIASLDQGGSQQQELQSALDLAFWQSIADSSRAGDFEDYLNRFPNGIFRSLAEGRLASLSTPTTNQVDALSKPEEPAVSEEPKTEEEPERALPVLTGRELVKAVQTELDRLGCEPGTPDGAWGRRSRSALANFRTAAGSTLGSSGTADMELLAALTETTDGICSNFCDGERHLQNGSCEWKPCSAGLTRSKGGECYKPKPKTAATSSGARASKPSSTPSNCMKFNGKLFCN